MKRSLTAPLLALTLVLASCGGQGPVVTPTPTPVPTPTPTPTPTPGNSISGTLTAPAGGDLTGLDVFACPPTDTRCTAGVEGQITSTGSYTITGLQATSYIIVGGKDVDASGTPTNGDYLGIYMSDGTTPAPVTPPATGIDITLQVVGGSPTPTPAELTGTWSGTTTTGRFGVEQTTLELVQSGTSLSGTLTLVGADGSASSEVTGTVDGSAVTVSAFFRPTQGGVETEDILEYRYQGAFSGTTLAGIITVLINDIEDQTGQFSLTRSGDASTPAQANVARRFEPIFQTRP